MSSRFPAAVVSLLLVAGCASSRSDPVSFRHDTGSADYAARPAAALVLDPPLTRELDQDRFADALDRTGRGAAASLGYDSPVIETSFVYVDDRQGFFGADLGGYGGYGYGGYGFGFGGRYDNYERRAVSTREFTRVRP